MLIGMACLGPSLRLIEMKKKLFLLGFTVEGFEQVGGIDSGIDIEQVEHSTMFAPKTFRIICFFKIKLLYKVCLE